MQVGGLGSGHGADAHHVTNCIHDHNQSREKTGGAGAKPSAPAETLTSEARWQQEPQFSLADWFRTAFGNGRSLLRNLWGGNTVSTNGASGSNVGEEQVMAQIGDSAKASAAAATVGSPTRVIQENPYFTALEVAPGQRQPLYRRIKLRLHDVAGQLGGKLPGRFFGFRAKNSFQAKQEKPREDLRKHSRYREDTLEIDCVLTDDSYLLDSYDRKGEYSKLSAGK